MTRLRKPIPRKPSKKIRDLSQKEINEIAVGPREYLSLYFDCEKFRLKDYESDLRNYEFLKLLTVDERQAMEDLPDQRFEPWHPDYDPERKRDDPDLLRELGLPMTLYHLARVQTFAGESPDKRKEIEHQRRQDRNMFLAVDSSDDGERKEIERKS